MNHTTCFMAVLTPLVKMETWTWRYIRKAYERHQKITLMVLLDWTAWWSVMEPPKRRE